MIRIGEKGKKASIICDMKVRKYRVERRYGKNRTFGSGETFEKCVDILCKLRGLYAHGLIRERKQGNEKQTSHLR